MTNQFKFSDLSPRAFTLKLGAGVGLACLSVACSASPEEPAPAPSVAQGVSVSAVATLKAFELTRPQRGRAEVGSKAGRLAAALGGDVAAAKSAFGAAKGDIGAVHAAIGASIKASHTEDNDSLELLDESVTRDTASALDVGPAAAKTAFLSTFSGLVANGAVDGTGLNPAFAKLSHLMQGEGVSGQTPVERIKEYVHTVPRMLNGIEVFGAGVKISVHRNGKVARVGTFGPTVTSVLSDSGSEEPSGAGFSFKQTVDAASADARVKAEFPNAIVKPVGLRYWLPAGVARAVVVPQHMYMVAHTVNIGGEQVKGRAFYVGYSSQDAGAAPTTWPHVDPNAKGDPRP